jgi:hypothetical protein
VGGNNLHVKLFGLRKGIKLVKNSVKCDVSNNQMPSASGDFATRTPRTLSLKLIRNGRNQIRG